MLTKSDKRFIESLSEIVVHITPDTQDDVSLHEAVDHAKEHNLRIHLFVEKTMTRSGAYIAHVPVELLRRMKYPGAIIEYGPKEYKEKLREVIDILCPRPLYH